MIGYGMMGWGPGSGIFPLAFNILILLILILIAVWLFQEIQKRNKK
ncbi:hypothetical protein M1349_03120 [Patescibacteria group bacterium]|nr:hypothetical protein [Patescibacteria group bacterium]